MNSELRAILAECIADMERGAGVEDCLKRNPSRAPELRPHLETWAALGGVSLVQPPRAAFNRGRREMLSALQAGGGGLSPLATAGLAPAWATAVAAVAAVLIVLGGAAGASAALGGPDVAGDVFDAVGVTDGEGDGGISHSSASERGLECANPNTFEGHGNSDDKAQNAIDAQEKESCSRGACEADGAAEDNEAEIEDDDAELGEDADIDDADGVNGHSNANGNGNGRADANVGANGNGNANANGQSNGQPCPEDSEDEPDGEGSTESEDGINNAPAEAETGKENANDNAFEGSGNADDRGGNRNDAGAADGSENANGQGQGDEGESID